MRDGRWRLVVNLFPASCALGYQVVEAELAHELEESVHELLATSWRKRQQALWSRELADASYIARHRSARADDALPVHEEFVYEYLQRVRASDTYEWFRLRLFGLRF